MRDLAGALISILFDPRRLSHTGSWPPPQISLPGVGTIKRSRRAWNVGPIKRQYRSRPDQGCSIWMLQRSIMPARHTRMAVAGVRPCLGPCAARVVFTRLKLGGWMRRELAVVTARLADEIRPPASFFYAAVCRHSSVRSASPLM